MKCPECKSNMVKEKTSMMYLTYPPQWDERWWCGCGYRGEWKRARGKTKEETLKEKWDQDNLPRI